MSIPTIGNATLAYLRQFDLSAVARTRDGRLISIRNPSGAEAAWWLAASDVGRVLRAAWADHSDVATAARRLGVRLVEHAPMMQRTEELVTKLGERIADGHGRIACCLFGGNGTAEVARPTRCSR